MSIEILKRAGASVRSSQVPRGARPIALLLAACSLLTGCMAESIGEAGGDVRGAATGDVDEVEQDLAIWTPKAHWTPGSVVNLCFMPKGTGDTADRDALRNAVNDTWGSAGNLSLQWRGTCPASIPADWISIWLNRGGWGGMGEPGRGQRLPTSSPDKSAPANATKITIQNQNWKRVDVRITTGGARGTARFSWTVQGGASGTSVTASSVALGTSGVSLSFASGSYVTGHDYAFWDSANDWERRSDVQTIISGNRPAVGTAATEPTMLTVGVHEMGHVFGFFHEHERYDNWHWSQMCQDEQGMITQSGLLTIYDPLSMMNYCHEKYGRMLGDYGLTHFDRVGMEILYPFTFTGRDLGCKRGCFYNRTGVVARSDALVTSDFIARGGNPTFEFGRISWSTPGAPAREGTYLTMNDVSASTNVNVSFSFRDVESPSRTFSNSTSGRRTVFKSNRMYAAMSNLLTSVL